MVDFLLVAVLGIVVGAAELAARYRDAPGRALKTLPGFLYLALNGVASIVTLASVRALGFRFDFAGEGVNGTEWLQVLFSGLCAMGILRSSFFKLRAADREIEIGPAALLGLLFDLVDRAVDRERARGRAQEVARVMLGVAYAKARKPLPHLCLALLQNLPEDEQKSLAEDVASLEVVEMEEETKTLVLGLFLMNRVGPDVLKAAVETLGEKIRRDSPTPLPTTTLPTERAS